MSLRLVFLGVAALVVAVAMPVRAQTSQEEVKATFVYRFASFVRWPDAGFVDAAAPIEVCVIGADPFVRTLRRVVAGQRAGARAFAVRRMANATDMSGCHMVYATGERTVAALRAAQQRPVLTITDGVGGGERGMIHFVLVDARVRFHIDDVRAAESRLSIDPRLLGLALSVRRRPGS